MKEVNFLFLSFIYLLFYLKFSLILKIFVIGLEYLLEICDKNRVSILKYYCVLCDEEFDVQELSESYIINHISGCNHITKYLVRLFLYLFSSFPLLM